MITTQKDLSDEISQMIEEGIEAGLVMDPTWITDELVNRRHSGDTAFYRLCAAAHVRDTVRKCLSDYKDTPIGPTEQLRLPGFEFLQKAYLIERDKQQVIVPLNRCTNEELKQKIQTYKVMSEGCTKHAVELERYRQTRFE